MAKPNITTRATKGSALTWTEGDTNLENLRDATITVKAGTGGTDVVSDLNGTVTLVAGTNVTITGDNTAKTVTINSTASGGATNLDGLSDVVITAAATGDLLYYNGTSWVDYAASSITVGTSSLANTINTSVDNSSNVNFTLLFSDGLGSPKSATGSGNLTFNPSTSTLTATNFSGTATSASTVSITADNSTNLARYVLFSSGTSGTTSPRTDDTFTFNPSTNTLSAGVITSDTGNFTTANIGTIYSTSSTAIRGGTKLYFYNSANTYYTSLTAGTLSANINFTLPNGYGSNNQVLTSNGAGGLSWTDVTATNATNATNVAITDDTTTATVTYPILSNGTSGNQGLETSSSKLSFQQSTGTLTATKFVGDGSGLTGLTAPAASIPVNWPSPGTAYNLLMVPVGTTTTTSVVKKGELAYDQDNQRLSSTRLNASYVEATYELRFFDNTNYVSLKAPTTYSGNVTWTLPNTDGTSGQALTTNGLGQLSWSSPSADWANPGTIGSSTPNTGKFTSLEFKNPIEPVYNLGTTGGTITPDPANGSVQKITLNSALTINGFLNATAGESLTLIIYGGTAYTSITSTMKFAGGVKTLTGTAGCIDILSIYYDGTTYFASLGKGFA